MHARRPFGLRTFAAKLRGFVRGDRDSDEFDAEVREHVRLLADRFVVQGMSREEAALTARRQFGNTTLLQEDRRDRWPVGSRLLGLRAGHISTLLETFKVEKFLGHSGANPGWYAHFRLNVERREGFVIANNSSRGAAVNKSVGELWSKACR